jgi:IS5 family transposase
MEGGGMEQKSFSDLAWEGKKKRTRREVFLAQMDAVIPWERLLRRVEPYYPKGEGGRPPMPLRVMLRIYFMQQWFNLSDPQAEDGLYDSESMRRFAGLSLEDRIPDETTILNFRHLLERHRLTQAIFNTVRRLLEDQRLLLKSGTIVDATLIAAPTSTKNQAQARDPQMQQVRKGRQWYFGLKLHVGTDVRGIVHSLMATGAAVSDISQMPVLLHGQEAVIYGDRAYWKEDDRHGFERRGVRYRVNRRGTAKHPLSSHWRRINRTRSAVRARGEHAFQVVKHLWAFTKVRYRGIAKNLARAFTLFALANLYLMRKRLAPA